MASLMSFALIFLQASMTCVVVAAVLLAVLALLRRRWPGVASQRLVWLLAMGAAAGAFMLALWAAGAGWRVLPSIEIARPAAAVASPAAVPDSEPGADSGGGDDGGLPLDATPAPRWLLALSGAWLLCYGAGLGLGVARLVRARGALNGLLACATPLDARALARHAGFEGASGDTPAVLESGAPVSPMLAGLRRPVLLLPRHLRSFDPAQQQLMVAHELAHWQRRDHWWLHASLLLQTVLWFNPALKALAGGLSHAQELGCDRQVLAHRPVAARRDYAAALVAQLKLQLTAQSAGAVGLAAPFAGTGAGAAAAVRERLGQLRLPDLGGSTRLAAAGKTALGACCVAVIGAAMLLQPAFAWRAPVLSAAPGAAPHAATPGTGQAAARGDAALPVWQAPLARVKVNSAYGPRPVQPTAQASPFHHGVDLNARRGTALLAPADGIVAESTDLYQGQAKFGKVIVIDHGGGLRSMYAHLDQRAVRTGDAVTAGQAIGKTGNTGKTTGPHLHFEVARDGERIDPQRLIAALRTVKP
jgi:murein DD-endopeptidase MepM/ murein hydrolase activator NlpD